jgi:hypothetical protein
LLDLNHLLIAESTTSGVNFFAHSLAINHLSNGAALAIASPGK